MKFLKCAVIVLLTCGFSYPGFGLTSIEDNPVVKRNDNPEIVLLAKRKKKGKKRVVREKHIVREARSKGKDSKNIDFDAVDIGGQRKTPLGTLINQNKADKNYDFVKIRLRWHPEMVQSASSLETGKTR